MPYPFLLSTTSAFTFSTAFDCPSHPSLLTHATTQRSVLRSILKKHKRLSPGAQQSTHLSSVLQALDNYLPYLFAIDAGLGNTSSSSNRQKQQQEEIDVLLKSTPKFEWRPTLTSTTSLPGREPPRVKLHSLEFEIYFVLSLYSAIQTLLSRNALHPLYTSTSAPPTPEQRTSAITTATKYLLTAASVMSYLTSRADSLPSSAATPSCADIRPSTFRALAAVAQAEATLLAVLKDDPYPAAAAQERNTHDKEWMIRGPSLPKVRAHLFARLCLAATEHAERASALLRGETTTGSSGNGGGKIDEDLLRYVEDLRRVGRGKACRFLGIDADLGGQTGVGIAWLRAGLLELGLARENGSGSGNVDEQLSKKLSSSLALGGGLSKLKNNLASKREDRRVTRDTAWGLDAGRAEEGRVLESLIAKWTKMNDTMNTQVIPASGPLLASQMPSGREVHSVKGWIAPRLDEAMLEGMRGSPEDDDDDGEDVDSSDEEAEKSAARKGSGAMAGTFPGTKEDYAGKGNYY